MTLKVNSSYEIAEGFIIPRSHISADRASRYLVVQLLTGGKTHYTSKYTTMTVNELKKAMNVDSKERINII